MAESTSEEVQYHIHLKKGDVGRYVFLPGDPGRAAQIATFFDSAEEVAFNREYRTFTGYVDGIKVSTMSTGIGCPSTAIAIEELIEVGADTFIRVGTSGSLQPGIDVGHLCISTAAVREEGTSRHYVPLSYPAVADLDVTQALRASARRLGFAHHCGISHCKDSFYIEEEGRVPLSEENATLWQVWQRANVISTAMESAALFVLSSIRKVRAGEILAVIGLTYQETPIVEKAGIDDAIRTAIEAVKLLHAQDSR